ncbi:MAG TPA: EthD family reductase, partial [Pseudomonas sp.]|nr:EthD family reductase [Pseudomonas sp.]
HIFSDSLEAFQAGIAPHAEEIVADIANYTDLTPVRQISEVVVGH